VHRSATRIIRRRFFASFRAFSSALGGKKIRYACRIFPQKFNSSLVCASFAIARVRVVARVVCRIFIRGARVCVALGARARVRVVRADVDAIGIVDIVRVVRRARSFARRARARVRSIRRPLTRGAGGF
jgi:hypothetical protein